MESGLFQNQGKKLAFIAVLLVGVALLVGGEEDPGVLASAQREAEAGAGAGTATAPPQQFAPPQAAAPAFAPAPAPPPAPAVTQPMGQPSADAVEAVYASGDELIDPATGYEPAPMLDPTPAAGS